MIFNVGASAWRVNVQHQQEPSHESDSETLLFVDSIQDTQARALWLDLSVPHINLISNVLCSANSLWGGFMIWRLADNVQNTAPTNCETVKGNVLKCSYTQAVSYVRCVQGENLIFSHCFFGGFVLEQTAKQNWFPTRVAVTLQMLLSIFVDYASSLACYFLITIDIHKDFLSHRIPDNDVQHKVLASFNSTG